MSVLFAIYFNPSFRLSSCLLSLSFSTLRGTIVAIIIGTLFLPWPFLLPCTALCQFEVRTLPITIAIRCGYVFSTKHNIALGGREYLYHLRAFWLIEPWGWIDLIFIAKFRCVPGIFITIESTIFLDFAVFDAITIYI